MPEKEERGSLFDHEDADAGKPQVVKNSNSRKPGQKEKEIDFENSLKRLEDIVDQMEKGQLSLDECLKHFEEGTNLAKFCTRKLDETEKRIEILSEKDGKKEWVNFEDSPE